MIQVVRAEGTSVEELSPYRQAMLSFRQFLLELEDCCWKLFEDPDS